MEESSAFEIFEMQLTETAKDFLKETAKWAYFLSILGYIILGFMFVGCISILLMSSVIGNMPSMGAFGASGGTLIAFIYLFGIGLYFFPIYYLNKFSTNLKAAFRDNNSESLTNSFRYLKSHYKFIGILIITLIAIYLLVIIGVIIFGISKI